MSPASRGFGDGSGDTVICPDEWDWEEGIMEEASHARHGCVGERGR
jgi:hypothetical protein